ncbi:hypothetical protein BST95_05500 [Halioglobus japonicus]|uniref:histidine kinase n=1 Tax=Halioglobus japonicus TaxID=930805 RepID=A0AAP8MDB5_9GAMM|nr:HAMP domain-containing sensor histidine kinase [Halioglobus japonicus]AQA17768.1 hypothetical protein BST95_05500 [Halioglobus japonicus]PLW85721.1 sensor histidine kinase [Halioglobus japonicus]GHD17153.1 two-component sensor histidine kinase [Halioglobus japonicus]
MFRSSVFRLTLLASLGFFLVVILLGGFLGALNLKDIEAREQEELLDHHEWLTELLAEDGLDALANELGEENEPWLQPDEEAFWILEDGDFAALISGIDGTPLLGLPFLKDAPTGLSERLFYFEDLDEALETRVYRGDAVRDHVITVARNRSWDYFVLKDTLNAGLFFLIIISIPLSLVIGYALSKRVHRRLDDLAIAVEQIGMGNSDQRASVSKHNDEFDTLATQVNSMLDRLEAMHRNIESVSIGVAHDIKTPLSRISNRLQLMHQDLADPVALEAHLTSAEQQVQTVLQVFSNLLRLSEIESADRGKRFSEVELSTLVEDVVESYQPVFVDAGRRLEPAILPDLRIEGDTNMLTQMLTNLLENSIEHGNPGGKTWVRLQSSKSGVLLQVGDDGPGIPPEHHSQIFERFYRADASRSEPGNGLGLAIVRSVSQLHGADITLLQGQKGTVFDCIFPTNP